jgi:hypothetical protein
MVVYPLVYIICTIPLASARMAAMSGSPPSLKRLCLAGAMITSNGWLDVLLYTVTRRIMIFSDDPPADDNGFDTFATFWTEKPRRFGGECTVEAAIVPQRWTWMWGRSRVSLRDSGARTESLDDLCDGGGVGGKDIKLVTTTKVTSESATVEDFEEMGRRGKPSAPVRRWSEDTGGSFGDSVED